MGRRIAPALGLFLLSPLIGEFLLGNLPVTMVFALIALAPLYGGGALLVRELARRRGAGWPGIVLLAVAYALVEEGLVTRSLFNPGYAGMDLTSYAWIPGVEVSAWWATFVLGGVHAAGSICVPIAVAESFVPARAAEPWLRLPGLVIAGLLFVVGAVAAAMFDPAAHQPSPAHVAGVIVLTGLLVLLGLRRRRPVTGPRGRAPGPWPVLGFSLAAGAVFWLAALALDILGAWPVVAVNITVYAAVCVLVTRWSRRPGWGAAQTFALAAGGVLTYAWHGFPQPPAVPVEPAIDLAGNTVFALAAVALLSVAGARLRSPRLARRERASMEGSP
ncbi:hypothetical protein FE391_12265 [Nonomuraea sp. KC401]|uniref:hypothetical protein n=1 Tax=unclassified Nonomuraea TaxID=2593643 RepID=UPI0010FD8F68|nr:MULTISPECIES: hypothetical protein [unclassified Nonomuraea]NBE95927.1 hypothetical protein [Nonomuraea sp. K271]TLF76272.1 hypothetical protein FE391_12265 [Nonomuraea sp. KC401]